MIPVAVYKGMLDKKKRSKYGAVKTKVDGINFDSKLEAAAYLVLQEAVKEKRIKYFLRQVPIPLPGGVTYRADFTLFYHDGRVRYLDFKGMVTAGFIVKHKIVEALYPIEIELFKSTKDFL